MAATLVASPAAPAQAISGGTVADITQYPYTVSVQAPVIMCAGALVDLRHVVTTATCVDFLNPEDVSVHAGSSKYYEGGVEKSVTAIDIHPNYNKTNNYDSNIAVLTLSGALPRSKSLAPIPLPAADSTDPAAGAQGVVTAFGAVDEDLTLPDQMQKIHLVLYGHTACQNYKYGRFTSTMLCAGDPQGVKDLCPADQGAPLAVNGKLIGIYSWGSSCGLANPNPSSPVFNRIRNFTKWINTVIARTS
jgi:secreted trypsin-like serine protease